MGSAQLSGTFQFNNQFNRFNRFNRFGGGCWNCGFFGFGFGFGSWGFGWPWLGFWGWDPFWFDPWWGWPTPGFGYYSYPNTYLYGYPASGYSAPNDNSTPPPQQDYQDNSDGYGVAPNAPSPSSAPSSATLDVPVLIYMKSGEVYAVRDYWMIEGELHYILISGVQNSVDLDQVDLTRTNTENAKSGVKFIFKSQPNIAPVAPDGNATPTSPGPSEPSPAPAPTQEINAAPQPEART
jgi:hypothetical protein